MSVKFPPLRPSLYERYRRKSLQFEPIETFCKNKLTEQVSSKVSSNLFDVSPGLLDILYIAIQNLSISIHTIINDPHGTPQETAKESQSDNT